MGRYRPGKADVGDGGNYAGREEAERLVKALKPHEEQIAKLEVKTGEEAKGDAVIERLKTIPGAGPKVAFAFAARVDVDRFGNGSQVANCPGLVLRVNISGTLIYYGGITKRGNGYPRALLARGVWALTWPGQGGTLKERYMCMTTEKGKEKKTAMVAIARLALSA
jgi:transposase